MFDSLLNEVSARFGISLDKAKLLLGSLIALIFNEKTGGVTGFVDRFRSLGLSGMVDSWIGSGANAPISTSQLTEVLGSQNIDDIASRTGVDRGTAASALAALLPGAFNTLTEDGRIPTGIPARITTFMDSMGDFFVGIGTGALGLGAAAVGGVANAAGRAGDVVGDAASETVDAIGDAGRATIRTVGNAADSVGDAARGATAYVSLEPCAHASDRGPACSDLLIAAGVARVVIAARDPDPRTDGAGLARLRAAGIEAIEGVLPAEARAAMAPWWTRQTRGAPFVTLKLATSLDGCIALADGSSRWITGERARAHGHH